MSARVRLIGDAMPSNIGTGVGWASVWPRNIAPNFIADDFAGNLDAPWLIPKGGVTLTCVESSVNGELIGFPLQCIGRDVL